MVYGLAITLNDFYTRSGRKRSSLSRWSIGQRLGLLVAALAVPLNLLVIGVIFTLTSAASDAQRTNLLYTARSIAAGVDAHLEKYIAVSADLLNSSALVADDLDTFELEARQTLSGISDAWVLVSNADGQLLLNTSDQAIYPLPRRPPSAITAQQHAVDLRSVIVTGVRPRPTMNDWIATIEAPVFRDSKVFRVVIVAMKLTAYLNLLSAQNLPAEWLVGIIDEGGRFVARVPNNDQRVGNLASDGWRNIQHQEGVFEFSSLEGDDVVHGNALSIQSGWAVGVAIKKSELWATAWQTVKWAVILGIAISLLSLALATVVARTITMPINSLRDNALTLVQGSMPQFIPGTPEIAELWGALQRAIEDRDQTEAELQQLSGRMTAIITSSNDAIISKTLDGIITSWNNSAERMFGYAAHEMVGQSIRRLIPQDRQQEEDEIIARLRRREHVQGLETVRMDRNGRPIEVSVTISPIIDETGKLLGASKFVRDISERKAREKKLRESEQRLSQIINNINAFAGLLDMDGKIIEVNSQAVAAAGVPREAILGTPMAEAPWWSHSPEITQRMREIIAQCLAGETIRCDLPYMTGTGEIRWVDFQAAPIREMDGEVTAVLPSGVDITERKRSEEQVRLLMHEINHRAKNMLSLVLAIARQTATSSPGDFVTRFSERIQSLAANQDLLVENQWRGIELQPLVRAQLAHFNDLVGTRIAVNGQNLRLTPAAAHSIGMALHELATNASKYGALSNAQGHIDIHWKLDNGRFVISWREQGGPPVEKPKRRGFGNTVLTTLAQASVSGEVILDYAPAGLVWQLTCLAADALENSLNNPLGSALSPGMLDHA